MPRPRFPEPIREGAGRPRRPTVRVEWESRVLIEGRKRRRAKGKVGTRAGGADVTWEWPGTPLLLLLLMVHSAGKDCGRDWQIRVLEWGC